MKATGIFNWPAEERQRDRYGMIGLYDSTYKGDATTSVALDRDELDSMIGRRVHIIARVLESRESSHIGDIFRGLYPTKPAVGEIVDLGEGRLTVENYAGHTTFGLAPDDGRDTDWFDPNKLYRLHDQTVELEMVKVA